MTTSFRLGDYFRLLRRHWLAVVLCLILGLGGALAYLQWAPKQYQATTAVLVLSVSDGTTGAPGRNNTINLDTEAQLVTATETAKAAAAKLRQSASTVDDLVSNTSVSVPPNTDILDITYTGNTPTAAQEGALAFAQAYLDQRQAGAKDSLDAANKALQDRINAVSTQLQAVVQAGAALPANSPERDHNNQQAAALNSQLSALATQQNQIQATVTNPGRIVTQPELPTSPSSPKTAITLAAGLILGLLAGIGLAALRNRSDDVIRRPEDLFRRTGVPVATVLSGRLSPARVEIVPPLSADGRGYARLRNLVTTALAQSDRHVVVVAGVRHGGGPVAANLAASLARAGENVYLVCADVFGATSSELLGDTAPRVGLAEVLAGDVAPEQALAAVPGVSGLRVLGPGRDLDRADALLQTRSPSKLLEQMLRSASYVIIEAPSTADSPDAQTLATVAELAVVVVEVGQTGAAQVLDACAQFESMGTPVLGGVVARYARESERDRKSGTPGNTGKQAERAADTDGVRAGGEAGNGSPGVRPATRELVPPGSREPTS